jgi:hypothetical protein
LQAGPCAVSEHPHLELEIFELANRFCPSVTEPFIQDEPLPDERIRGADRLAGRNRGPSG